MEMETTKSDSNLLESLESPVLTSSNNESESKAVPAKAAETAAQKNAGVADLKKE